MISEEEKQEIVDRAVEAALLKLPEVVGNLMATHSAAAKANKEFYEKYPEFKDKTELVRATVESIEGKNPNLEYEEILKKAVPEIRKRTRQLSKLDTESAKKPDKGIKFSGNNSESDSDHGEI